MGMDSSIFFHNVVPLHHVLLLAYLTYIRRPINTVKSFLLFTAMSYNIVCMPEKWSLPGGEYRRIIVKDHLKIKKAKNENDA